MSQTSFITRVVLRNYKSIGSCDVRLGPLTYLVGANGSGKSNFLDSLHLVRDALSGSLDNAINERGGLDEVRRRSRGHPHHFGIRLEFILPDGRPGHYAFNVGALPGRSYVVQREECAIGRDGPRFRIENGQLKESSENPFPATTPDRLALVSVSGLVAFRPAFDALTAMGFYNLNPKLMREPQKPQDGRLLRSAGENLVSVIGHLERSAPEQLQVIQEYLTTVVPSVQGVARRQIGPLETLQFRQASNPWRFMAQNMSDGTLRALGVLTALFQSNSDFAPLLVGIEEPETALHPAASAALREALLKASSSTQVLVTSHSPELLDDPGLRPEHFLAVVAEAGETKIAPLDQASRSSMLEQLFSAGELLRLNQLDADRSFLQAQERKQAESVRNVVIRIASIVEGDGEVASLPILLRRLVDWRHPGQACAALPPIKVKRDRFLNREDEFNRHLLLAASKCGESGLVLILLDADDDCPARKGAEVLARARTVIAHRRAAVVFANREFEAWFIGAAQSLEGVRGFKSLPADAQIDPEVPRDAKGWIKRRMPAGYGETTDQPAFTSQFDLQQAHRRCRSFRKLCDELDRHAALGAANG